MGSQPYSSLHFIYIPGCIDQSDWEQSPRLRRGIKRQKCLRSSHPSLIIPPLFLHSPPQPERRRYCPKCHSRSDTSTPCALPIDLASGRPEKGALAAGPISSCWRRGVEEGGRVGNTICEIGYDAHVILQTGGTEIVQFGGSLAVWTEVAEAVFQKPNSANKET